MNHIEILAKIPFDRKIAEAYSTGKIVANELPEFKSQVMDLAVKIEESAST